MRTKFLILFVLLLGSCGAPTEKSSERFSEPQYSSEDFDAFLSKFNSDSAFQLSRIVFPLEEVFLDPHEGGEATMIYEDSADWKRFVNLEYSDKYFDGVSLDFGQDTIWNQNSVIIQQRGSFSKPNTQWYVDYEFSMIDSKWYLTSLKDLTY